MNQFSLSLSNKPRAIQWGKCVDACVERRASNSETIQKTTTTKVCVNVLLLKRGMWRRPRERDMGNAERQPTNKKKTKKDSIFY